MRNTHSVPRVHSGLVVDYSDKCWAEACERSFHRVMAVAAMDVRNVPNSPAAVLAFLGLARGLLVDAITFQTEASGALACAASELPDCDIQNPWGASRMADLTSRVDDLLVELAEVVVAHALTSPAKLDFLLENASVGLKLEIAREWELGKRDYHREMKSFAIGANGRVEALRQPAPHGVMAAEARATGSSTKRGKRGETTDERLNALFSTAEGRNQLLAAGSAAKIAGCIGRAKSTVIDSPVWKGKIKRLLAVSRTLNRYERLEQDERRRDRN